MPEALPAVTVPFSLHEHGLELGHVVHGGAGAEVLIGGVLHIALLLFRVTGTIWSLK